MEKPLNSILRKEIEEIKLRHPHVVSIGRKNLLGTAFSETFQFSDQDINKMRGFLVEVAPYTSPHLSWSYWEHIFLASLYGFQLGIHTDNNINPYETAAGGFWHDGGRLLIPNRYFVNDLMNKSLSSQIGIRRDFLEQLAPLDRILGITTPLQSFKELTLAQMINHISDYLGRKMPDGSLVKIDDLMAVNSGKRYPGGVWKPEDKALSLLNQPGKEEWANKLVVEEVAMFQHDFGIDFSAIRDKVTSEFMTYENQGWIYRVMDAQQTLDQKFRRSLGKPPITHIVFDVGGVLFESSEGELTKRLSSRLGLDQNHVFQILSQLVDDTSIVSGRTSNEEFLSELWGQLNLRKPQNFKEISSYFYNPDMYSPISGMPEIVEDLAKNPQVELYVLSDSIKLVAEAVKKGIKKLYPQFPKENIFISGLIGQSKREPEVFCSLSERLGGINPQSILFIDDRTDFVSRARSSANITAFHFRDNPHTGTIASDQFQKELVLAGLI